MQAKYFKYWLFTSFVEIAVFEPTVLVLKYDFNFNLSMMVLVAPLTLAWALLILFQIIEVVRIYRFRKQTTTLFIS